MQSFKDLVAWQEAHKLALEVYRVTRRFPKEEQFALVNQVRRAAVSITSNLAEGFGRSSPREKGQFYSIAKGSLSEAESQLLIARDLSYMNKADFLLLEEGLQNTGRLITGLLRANKGVF